MCAADRKRLFADVPKMNNMVNSVAQFLADCLQIRDDEIDVKEPFVEVSRKELRYFIEHESKIKPMCSLKRIYNFVVRAENLANRMWHCCGKASRDNISIAEFTCDDAYYEEDQLIIEGNVQTTIDVGGIGQRLMNDVKTMARTWLEELDVTLCRSSSINKTYASSQDENLLYVKDFLATAIAERLTLMSYESVLDDSLSARSLEKLLNGVYRESKTHASEEKQHDANLIHMLCILSSDPEGADARSIVENNIDSLRELTTRPPSELECRREYINLERLARAFQPDMDIEVRVELVAFWSLNSPKASSEAKAALQQVMDWIPIERVVKFHSIISRDASNCKARREYMLPLMNFLYTPTCFACKRSERRSGLTEAAARSECLIRAVWELASVGIFEGGVLSADVVTPVALDVIVFSRMAAKNITNERDIKKLGFKMRNFVSKVYDMEGDHVRAIDKATCSLSMFSCKELETVFDTAGESLSFLCSCLTARTRNLMSYTPNKSYASFAIDALGLLLPLVYQRRDRLGISTLLRSNAFLDMLRTIPRMQQWDPTKGTLQLTIEDLEHGHKSFRGILNDLHEHGVVVRRKGSDSSKRKIRYEFDTLQLWNMITKHAALIPI